MTCTQTGNPTIGIEGSTATQPPKNRQSVLKRPTFARPPILRSSMPVASGQGDKTNTTVSQEQKQMQYQVKTTRLGRSLRSR